MLISAPIASRQRRKPVRVGLSPTCRSKTSEPGVIAAAANANTADEISAGTANRHAFSLEPPSTLQDEGRLTPKIGNMRSVWSLLRRGSRTRVVPEANKPASNTQDLICALATGDTYSIAFNPPQARIDRGAVPACVGLMSAPIMVRGTTMRFIGLLLRESSPLNVLSKP